MLLIIEMLFYEHYRQLLGSTGEQFTSPKIKTKSEYSEVFEPLKVKTPFAAAEPN